jgi:hypothetical protein
MTCTLLSISMYTTVWTLCLISDSEFWAASKCPFTLLIIIVCISSQKHIMDQKHIILSLNRAMDHLPVQRYWMERLHYLETVTTGSVVAVSAGRKQGPSKDVPVGCPWAVGMFMYRYRYMQILALLTIEDRVSALNSSTSSIDHHGAWTFPSRCTCTSTVPGNKSEFLASLGTPPLLYVVYIILLFYIRMLVNGDATCYVCTATWSTCTYIISRTFNDNLVPWYTQNGNE